MAHPKRRLSKKEVGKEELTKIIAEDINGIL